MQVPKNVGVDSTQWTRFTYNHLEPGKRGNNWKSVTLKFNFITQKMTEKRNC